MSYIANINDKNVVFGLEWRQLGLHERLSEKKEVALLAKHDGATQAVVFHRKGAAVCGFMDEKPPKGPLYAAAAIFAETAIDDNALLIQSLDNNRYCLIGIRDGAPTTLDFIGDKTQVIEKAKEYIAESGGNQKIEIYSSGGVFTSEKEYHLSGQPFNSKSAQLFLKPVSGSRLNLIILTIVVFSLFFGAYQYLEKKRMKDLQAVAQPQVDPVQQYRRFLAAELKKDFNQPAARSIKEYTSLIDKQAVYRAAWRLIGADCAARQCTLTWKEEMGGTNFTFASQPDVNQSNLVFDLDGRTLRQTLVAETGGNAKFEANPQAFPTMREFFLKTGSRLQEYRQAGMVFGVAAPQVFAKPPGVALPDTIPGGYVHWGRWELSGIYGVALEAVTKLPGNMTLRSLKVSFDENKPLEMTFMARGYYYVRF